MSFSVEGTITGRLPTVPVPALQNIPAVPGKAYLRSFPALATPDLWMLGLGYVTPTEPRTVRRLKGHTAAPKDT